MVVVPGLRGRSKLVPHLALVASVAVHVVVITVSARLLSSSALPQPRFVRTVEVTLALDLPRGSELPLVSARASAVSERPRQEPQREPSTGALSEPRPDTRAAGRGGSRESSAKALHLSDSIDGLTLDRDPTLFTATSQVSRLDTADERRSREDRRATPDPMELTFVAGGVGTRLSRLAPASSDPALGALGAVPVRAGAAEERPEEAREGGWRPPTEPRTAGAKPVPALGVDHGSEQPDYRRSAAVALARPSVREGRASIATTERGRPNDTLDSSEEVASVVQSLVTASSAGGPEGRGPGGTVGAAAPGSGGSQGPGSRARPAGEGGPAEPGSVLGIRGYAAALTRKVYPFWEDALPMWARIEGRGGLAVIGVTLGENGTIRELHVVRGSGIPEFDQKVATALERASPYGPLPRSLRRVGSGGLELHIAFDAMNPAVGRAGQGPGGR